MSKKENELKQSLMQKDKEQLIELYLELKAELARQENIAQHMSFVLYSALYELLEKDNEENVASIIDQMTWQNNGELCDMYKEYKNLKAENEKLCQQVISLNKDNNKLRKFQEDILGVRADPYRFLEEIKELQQKLQTNTKQVCEKIKKKFDTGHCYLYGETQYVIFKRINEVENELKGESDDV